VCVCVSTRSQRLAALVPPQQARYARGSLRSQPNPSGLAALASPPSGLATLAIYTLNG